MYLQLKNIFLCLLLNYLCDYNEIMNSLRDSLASIPGTLTNFISDTASVASSYIPIVGGLQGQNDTTSTDSTTESIHSLNELDSSSTGAVLISEKSLPIPSTLVKEQWRLIFTSEASEQDLREAICHCKDLVLITEENTEERRWLVRHLVDLRYSLEELLEAKNDKTEVGPSVKTVVGHHFVARQKGVIRGLPLPTARQYCDHCTGIIWSVVQASYQCSDCRYIVHQKCLDSVVRICAHVVASERQYPILDICPEIGLAAQRYKCSECNTYLNFSKFINLLFSCFL